MAGTPSKWLSRAGESQGWEGNQPFSLRGPVWWLRTGATWLLEGLQACKQSCAAMKSIHGSRIEMWFFTCGHSLIPVTCVAALYDNGPLQVCLRYESLSGKIVDYWSEPNLITQVLQTGTSGMAVTHERHINIALKIEEGSQAFLAFSRSCKGTRKQVQLRTSPCPGNTVILPLRFCLRFQLPELSLFMFVLS